MVTLTCISVMKKDRKVVGACRSAYYQQQDLSIHFASKYVNLFQWFQNYFSRESVLK